MKPKEKKEFNPNPRKEELIKLCLALILQGAKQKGINQTLRHYYFLSSGATELKTYNEWQTDGYQVKKGSKSFLVWTRPIKDIKKEQAQAQGKELSEEDKMRKFFNICHLFDISQVEKQK